MAQQPMYQHIADMIRLRIERGEWDPGSQLPTELALRSEFNASRNTIRDAIKRLSDLNLVEARPGRGTFVKIKVDPFVTNLSARTSSVDPEGATYLSEVNAADRKARTTEPKVELPVPPAEVLRMLSLPADTQTVLRRQDRYIDEIPWSQQMSYYLMEFVTRGATDLLRGKDIPSGAVSYLAEKIGVRETRNRDWITTRLPDESERTFFRIPPETMVFEVYRTGFDQNGKPMRVTVTVFRADHNQFIIDSGEVSGPRYESGPLDPDQVPRPPG